MADLINAQDSLNVGRNKINTVILGMDDIRNKVLGNYINISDALNYDTTSHILSWPDTYVFGTKSNRIPLRSGEIDLTKFGNNSVVLFFDSKNGVIIARFATDTSTDTDILLGIMYLSDLKSSILNFKLKVNGSIPLITSDQISKFGRWAFIPDTVDYNTTTKLLSWNATYVFGGTLSRTPLNAGSVDLTNFSGSVIIYFNSSTGTINAKSALESASEDHITLGILWLNNFTRSLLNFKLTVNGVDVKTLSTQRTPFGRYCFISDPIDYNPTTKTLSWSDTYVFGSGLSRTRLYAGTLDLSSYSGVAILFFNSDTGIMEARTATAASSESLLFIGLFWLNNFYQNKLNAILTVNGKSLENQFFLKKYNSMGDSITAAGKYQAVINQVIGFKTINNYGIGGTCLASTDENDTTSMAYRVTNMDFTADVISISGGTNDWGNIPAKPLGQIGDTQKTTVYGAIDSIIRTVLTNAPTTKLFFITPLQRNFKTSPTTTLNGWSETTVNELGYKLVDVVNAIKEVCARYAVPVLDLYHTSGFTDLNLDELTVDGLHPNDVGHEKIGKQIAAFIKNL
ncbi:phi ETA orf 55-like protein [Niallia circulans]|uniref:SGNH/GDSL hydrolase family protein n=1 Tax=Niallia circulans TaxID=1397 RepID=UPI00077C74BE|nr:SGNH/GDSL hydrolase family protein [Niallia circulans]MDR4318671.1 SGNH/GDSL hydrolase family protein [Niallia circulans]MED3839368.1 SGNH/GDSL hydrolase family protein [Niallia circulans]MED4245351.1 SGNH/GDSL hydrolase family protein [Niallia circulans]MED4250886.1 SGNH/GDSL hydrolase family protein [Niallia circulans]QKH60165.1 SGNH/GDSL hydrolase family protein [Niallia circulans]